MDWPHANVHELFRSPLDPSWDPSAQDDILSRQRCGDLECRLFAPWKLLSARKERLQKQVSDLMDEQQRNNENSIDKWYGQDTCLGCTAASVHPSRQNDLTRMLEVKKEELQQTKDCIKNIDDEKHHGKQYCVHIQKASEPEVYMYENIQASPFHVALWLLLEMFLIVAVLIVCVYCVIIANAYQGRTGYANNCFDVLDQNMTAIEPACLVPADDSVPSASAEWYKSAFIATRTLTELNFPTISSTEAPSCEQCDYQTNVADQRSGGLCCPIYQYDRVARRESSYVPDLTDVSEGCIPRWNQSRIPNWADAKAASCRRVDKDGILQKNADLDSVCYACICTVVNELKKHNDYVENDASQKLYRPAHIGTQGLLSVISYVPETDYVETDLAEILAAYHHSLAGLDISIDRIKAATETDGFDGGYCAEWNAESRDSTVFGIVAMLAVSLFNLILKYALIALVKMGKNITQGKMEYRVGVAVYFTQLLNRLQTDFFYKSLYRF
eukprot:SAG31_NODE_6071_length_2183_cov_1.654511_2_plen_500_part_00